MRPEVDQVGAFGHAVADAEVDGCDDAIGRRDDRVLHLHRFEHDQRRALRDPVARLHHHRDDRAGHRRGQVAAVRVVLGRVRQRVDERSWRRAPGANTWRSSPSAITVAANVAPSATMCRRLVAYSCDIDVTRARRQRYDAQPMLATRTHRDLDGVVAIGEA